MFFAVCLSFGVYNMVHNILVFVLGFSASLFYLLYVDTGSRLRLIKSELKFKMEKVNIGRKTGSLESLITVLRRIYVEFGVIILLGAVVDQLYLVLIIYAVILPLAWITRAITYFKNLKSVQ